VPPAGCEHSGAESELDRLPQRLSLDLEVEVPQSAPRFPAYGSREHMEWIARRLSRNLAFRRRLEEGRR
jgi:hypothetical protein